ncbi:MAG TPA: EthD domain-containing protein, partial [Terriglobales bacterium]|nr:EthD domain-containing protein [Terriglobales bacterium]
RAPQGVHLICDGRPMVKIVYCITKKPGMSDDEFFHYWKEVHGPLGSRIPGLRKLVQSRRISLSEDQRAADFDGVAELWFDDADSLLRARQSPEWKESTEDEAKFIDHRRVGYLISEEQVIFDSEA